MRCATFLSGFSRGKIVVSSDLVFAQMTNDARILPNGLPKQRCREHIWLCTKYTIAVHLVYIACAYAHASPSRLAVPLDHIVGLRSVGALAPRMSRCSFCSLFLLPTVSAMRESNRNSVESTTDSFLPQLPFCPFYTLSFLSA